MPRLPSDRLISISSMDKLIRKTHANRVSEAAAKELSGILEGMGLEIAGRALENASHANRSTVKDVDVQLAYKQWRGT